MRVKSRASSSPISDEIGERGEESAIMGDEGQELLSDVDRARRGARETAGEKGGGDEGGNGDRGVKISSASMLLSLSLVRGGSGSIDSSAGEVGMEGRVTGDEAEFTSGTECIFSHRLSVLAGGETGTDLRVEGAGSDMGREDITTLLAASFAGTELRFESNKGRWGSVFHRPRSADVRKYVGRIPRPSSLNEKPGSFSCSSSCESERGIADRWGVRVGSADRSSPNTMSICSEESGESNSEGRR